MLTAASQILLILATVLSLDGQPAVQAQDNQGAIGNLSVSSPDPGQLVYVHGVWDGFPSMSVFTQQDANLPFYPSIPEAACWTTWHRVFATPGDVVSSTTSYNDTPWYC